MEAKNHEHSLYQLSRHWTLYFSILTGVDNIGQLKENVALFAKGPLEKATLDEIEKCVPAFPEEIVRPNRWPKKA